MSNIAKQYTDTLKLSQKEREEIEYVIEGYRAEIEQLRRDAERYRWILKNAGYGVTERHQIVLYLDLTPPPDHMAGLSDAIDRGATIAGIRWCDWLCG